MSYALFNLLIDLIGDLGQSETFLATGGSTTTIINAKIGERTTTPQDNYAIDGFAIVARDAGLAGAAPEGQFQRISLYDSSTFTYTVDTAFTVAPAVGDEIMLVSSKIPLREMISRINSVMRRLTITLPDVTLTTVTGQQLYSLPVGAKRDRPRMVEIQTVSGDNDTYQKRHDYEYITAAPGTAGGLRFDGVIDGGMTMRIQYDTGHTPLTSYSSTISETIAPELAIAECKVAILEWLNNLNGGTDDFWKTRENMAKDDLLRVRRVYKISKPQRAPKRFTPPTSGW